MHIRKAFKLFDLGIKATKEPNIWGVKLAGPGRLLSIPSLDLTLNPEPFVHAVELLAAPALHATVHEEIPELHGFGFRV